MKKIVALTLALILVIACISTAFAAIPKPSLKRKTCTVSGSKVKIDYASTNHTGYKVHLKIRVDYQFLCAPNICGHPAQVLRGSKIYENTSSKPGNAAGFKDTINAQHSDDVMCYANVTIIDLKCLPKD